MKRPSQLNLLSVLAISSFLTACASAPQKATQPKDEALNVERHDKNSLEGQILGLKKRYQEAEQNNMAFFSPRHMKEGKSALEDAMSRLEDRKKGSFSLLRGASSLFSSKTPEQIIQEQINQADKALKAAKVTKALVQKAMKPQFDEMDYLRKIQTPKYFPSEFADINSMVNDVIEAYEDEPVEQAEKVRIELASEQRALEVRTIKYTYLNEAKSIKEMVIDEQGEDFAPVSLEEAKKAIEASEKIIEKNPRDMDAIRQSATWALHQSQRAHALLFAAKDLSMLKDELETGAGEKHLIAFEQLLKQVGNAIGVDDFQYMAFPKQAELLSQSGATLLEGQKDTTQLATQINALKKKWQEANESITALKSENQNLKMTLRDNEAKMLLLLQPESTVQTPEAAEASAQLSEGNVRDNAPVTEDVSQPAAEDAKKTP